jgi:hypothetical protein
MGVLYSLSFTSSVPAIDSSHPVCNMEKLFPDIWIVPFDWRLLAITEYYHHITDAN